MSDPQLSHTDSPTRLGVYMRCQLLEIIRAGILVRWGGHWTGTTGTGQVGRALDRYDGYWTGETGTRPDEGYWSGGAVTGQVRRVLDR